MKQTLVAAERIEPGQSVIVENGLVRLAIPNVHRADRVAAVAVDTINRGETALWDMGNNTLKRKPATPRRP